MDMQTALKHIKNGWIAALVTASFTFALVTFSLLSTPVEGLEGLANPIYYIDVTIPIIFAFFIYKKSRIAATLMFIYFLASKIITIVETGEFTGVFMGLMFLYFYFMAMLGTYKYHKLKLEYDSVTSFE